MISSRINRHSSFSGWLIVSVLGLVVLCLVPTMALILEASGNFNITMWRHLIATNLSVYLTNTVLLLFGVGLGSLFWGLSTAWLVALYRFPGRRLVSVLLITPLAVPTYLVAFVYTDLFDSLGGLRAELSFMLEALGLKVGFISIRNVAGLSILFGAVLYPYVYLLARITLSSQVLFALEAGRSLGRTTGYCLWNLVLPICRPAIVGGLIIVLMETVSEFGAVDYFAIPTLSVGIYQLWFGMNSAEVAVQLALLTLLIIVVLYYIERRARRWFNAEQTANHPGYSVSKTKGWLMLCFCLVPVTIGLIIPVLSLIYLSLNYWEAWNLRYLMAAWHSILLAVLAIIFCLVIAICANYFARIKPSLGGLSRLLVVSYAMPATVLALGAIIFLSAFDHALNDALEYFFAVRPGLLLSGSIMAVVYCCVVRFIGLAYNSIESGLSNVSIEIDEVSQTFGQSKAQTLYFTHLPMLKNSLITASILVFVECIKELPMTILVRPFNFNTLATTVYEYVSFEDFQSAAPHALSIIIIGLFPMLILGKLRARAM